MKATGIARRIDDLGRVVIPKEIRRTIHIHNDSLHKTLAHTDRFCDSFIRLAERIVSFRYCVFILFGRICLPSLLKNFRSTAISLLQLKQVFCLLLLKLKFSLGIICI